MSTDKKIKLAVFIDPGSHHFAENRLFDLKNETLNRDGTLLPFVRMRDRLASKGVPVYTADYLRRGENVAEHNHYWSMGHTAGYEEFKGRDDVTLKGFLLYEPPLVVPKTYALLETLAHDFETVYLHNTIGDGYKLTKSMIPKLAKLHVPQPYVSEVEPYWGVAERQNKIVVIAGNHNPRLRKPEYYSRRIHAIRSLAKTGDIDLFGRGWERWWSKQSAWPTYWLNRSSLMASYRGTCASKLEVLSRYRFSLCFENTPVTGYLTEKIFDCLYAGTVPVYLGAPDIAKLVPPAAYVDMNKFASYKEMWRSVKAMSESDWQDMREAGREFLRTVGRDTYANALDVVS